jgi:hypothetical protein
VVASCLNSLNDMDFLGGIINELLFVAWFHNACYIRVKGVQNVTVAHCNITACRNKIGKAERRVRERESSSRIRKPMIYDVQKSNRCG